MNQDDLIKMIAELKDRVAALEAAHLGPTGGYYWLSKFAKPEHVEEAYRKVKEKRPQY